MNKNYSADKPVLNQKDDRFQRYDFAKRIAANIIQKETTDCIVIGLYGVWGEGKTSVLNFINQELQQGENVVTIKFNPWRFNDEVTLLSDFFNLLANKLNTSLESNGDKASQLLKKYSKLAAPITKFIPFVGSVVSDVFEKVSDVLPTESIEELKEKIDAILKESKKKIIVFVDDIDRLDRNEIHSIFKLVKLTADFYNTTYILSFDDNMVAAAIGERFGEGDKTAGKNFLEKIIQVPLYLPLAQPAALQQLCFDIINDFFSSSKFELNEDDSRSFSAQFQNNILLRLTTPRLAIRYGNSLSFSIPLLYGEVNMSDLLIIEAVKIFYPKYYGFIKTNPDFFIGRLSNYDRNKEKIDLLNKQFDILASDLSDKERGCIKYLLIELFPLLNRAYNNHYYDNTMEGKFYKKMRIGSPKYFSRYFTYSVIKGDLSDVVFRNFIAGASIKLETEVADMIKQLIADSSVDSFLFKLRSFEGEYDWATAKKIAAAIATNSNLFPDKEGQFLMRFEQPKGQSQIFIARIIKLHKIKNEAFEFTKHMFKISETFEYALDLNAWFKTDKEDDKVFSDRFLQELDYELIHRAMTEAGDISIFEKFDDKIAYLITSWFKINPQELQKYYKSFIDKNPKEAITLLKVYTQTMWSSLFPEPYKTDFPEENFKLFESIFDKEYIAKKILEVYSINEIEAEEVIWIGKENNTQTELNIARQFFYWKNQNK